MRLCVSKRCWVIGPYSSCRATQKPSDPSSLTSLGEPDRLPKKFTPGMGCFRVKTKTTAGKTRSWLFLNRQIMFPACKPQNVDRPSASESS
jgi:hypothetical protein